MWGWPKKVEPSPCVHRTISYKPRLIFQGGYWWVVSFYEGRYPGKTPGEAWKMYQIMRPRPYN